jgi:hypothetical protein
LLFRREKESSAKEIDPVLDIEVFYISDYVWFGSKDRILRVTLLLLLGSLSSFFEDDHALFVYLFLCSFSSPSQFCPSTVWRLLERTWHVTFKLKEKCEDCKEICAMCGWTSRRQAHDHYLCLKADMKLFRLLTFAGLVSGTGGGCGAFFAVAVAVTVAELLTVERRFAVLAGSWAWAWGKAWGGDWDFDLLRECASADLGAALSRYAGLVLSVGDAIGGGVELFVGMLLRLTVSDLEDLCFLESDDLTVGAGAASSLLRRGRELISALGWTGRPPTVFGLP